MNRSPQAFLRAGPLLQRPGRALPGDVERENARAFGHDFARVRVHDDADAAAFAGVLGARAFTIGSDIFFAAGRYRPRSARGRALLRHELTHEKVQAVDGWMQVPDRPGLGVTLDEGFVRRYLIGESR